MSEKGVNKENTEVSKTTLYIASGTVVTVGMVVVKAVATVINKAVAFLLEVQ